MEFLFPLRNPHRVYCAGPLFNSAERQTMEEISQALVREGFETFVPHADGLEFTPVHQFLVAQGNSSLAAGRMLHAAIFALDSYQVICGCGSLVFNLNGRVPDEGAVAELSMAWTLGKPVAIFKDDVRSKIAGRDNPLVVGQTDFQVVQELGRLAPFLRKRLAEFPAQTDWQMPCPANLRLPLARGAQLWQGLQSLGEARPSDLVAEIICAVMSGTEADLCST